MYNRFPAKWKINNFRKPLDPTLTPYRDTDINFEVGRFCRNFSSKNDLKNGKVIFIGDTGVGKTSLIRRFCKNKFNPDTIETAGIDSENEAFSIFGVSYNIEIWDTAGQERFKWITTSYYRGVNVVVIVFDLSDINSLYSCKEWLEEAEYENNFDCLFIVGNKRDVLPDPVYDDIMKKNVTPIVEDLNGEYWAVSSKTGKNVKNLFFRIAFLSFQSIILKDIGNDIDRNEVPDPNISLQNLIRRSEEQSCGCS